VVLLCRLKAFSVSKFLGIVQALINNILYSYLDIFVLAYFDNIFIYSKIYKEYVKHVTLVLKTLRDAGIRI
jgi:bacteriorhodopsin